MYQILVGILTSEDELDFDLHPIDNSDQLETFYLHEISKSEKIPEENISIKDWYFNDTKDKVFTNIKKEEPKKESTSEGAIDEKGLKDLLKQADSAPVVNKPSYPKVPESKKSTLDKIKYFLDGMDISNNEAYLIGSILYGLDNLKKDPGELSIIERCISSLKSEFFN